MRNLLMVGLVVAGVGPLPAQTAGEFQVQAVGVARADPFVGGGVGFALRSPRRTRLGMGAAVGAVEGAVAARGDLLLSYHLLPNRRRGVTPYAGGGLSVLLVGGRADPYLMLVAGVEAAPGARRGWFLEGGIAGGVRVAAGWRFRWGGRIR